jgi:hypothetical protein
MALFQLVMALFQLDECLNDPEFVQQCEDAAKAAGIQNLRVKRFPRALKNEDDPIVLGRLLQENATLLTKDRKIATDHPDAVPDVHGGIVIIANARRRAGTMTVKLAQRVLNAFKAKCPSWHELPLQNSIIEINQDGIDISRKAGGAIVRTKYLSFDEASWDQALATVLANIAQRGEEHNCRARLDGESAPGNATSNNAPSG